MDVPGGYDMFKALVLVAALVPMAGCWNGNPTTNIDLGSVSFGQQLIDLKAAYEQGAMNEEEYQRLRSAIVSLEHVLTKEAGASR